MDQKLSAVFHKRNRKRGYPVDFLSEENAMQVLQIHKTIPQYAPTPLVSLKNQAALCGVKNIFIKDESKRFSLNAFKALGASYAMICECEKRLGLSAGTLTFESAKMPPYCEQLSELCFVTATDGNHGHAVAWAARQLGAKAMVFMPKGSSPLRLARIQNEGAQAEILDLSYDECVLHAAETAKHHPHAVLLQDTAWDGYEQIPAWIMQGYTTMALECLQQTSSEMPFTHIFVQAGVGSFAAAITGFFAQKYGPAYPRIYVLEPNDAACFYESAKIGDGNLHAASGKLQSIMAGLCCGVPSSIAGPILLDYADGFLCCDDSVTEKGMRILSRPGGNDPSVISGESGAVGMGVIHTICTDPAYKDLKAQMQLDEYARILLFSTEGDTDPVSYQKIVCCP